MKKSIRFLFFIMLTIGVLSSCSPKFNLAKSPTINNAELYKAFVENNLPSEDAFVGVQRLTEIYINKKQWDSAVMIYRKYQPLFPGIERKFNKIISILEADPENLIISNLGRSINSEYGEYAPVLSADELKLYFTGNKRKDGSDSEDIFVSGFVDGQWQPAKNIGNQINTSKRNESLDGISADATQLILFGNYHSSFGKGDIYFVDKAKKGWGKLSHFPVPVNSEFFESNASISSDGRVLIFNSDRPGGDYKPVEKGIPFHGSFMGNVDIYVCLKTDQGWSEPINLGLKINTPYCEYAPFLHPDGKTLYFSSDGHPGIGRLDVFKSVRLDENSWTSWSEPVNLGKQINTPGHDWGYKVATSGSLAYFSTDKRADSFGKEDIYTITVPVIVRPDPVAIISGSITDENSQPVDADIIWEDLSTREIIGQLKSDPETGNYLIVLPLNKNYGYYASKSGYYPESKNIDLVGVKEATTLTENINLKPIREMIKAEVAIVLNNIFFEYDQYVLLPESFPELDRLAKILKENPNSRVEILGHTDSNGTDEYNLILSENRAKAVVEYLVSTGCNSNRIAYKGYGESKPIDTNDTDEGKARNRRVEFMFLKD